MRRRQTMPSRWLIIAAPDGAEVLAPVRQLPRGSGILLLQPPSAGEMRRLRRAATHRNLAIVVEGRGTAVRVHNAAELREALLARTPMILLSPMLPTPSHPDWLPLPRMRAAALARLARRRLVALGGMDERRYAAVARLGFIAWAGISAFRT